MLVVAQLLIEFWKERGSLVAEEETTWLLMLLGSSDTIRDAVREERSDSSRDKISSFKKID